MGLVYWEIVSLVGEWSKRSIRLIGLNEDAIASKSPEMD
jgi:hypothetical protein